MKRTAVISDCGKYRYRLTRVWDDTLPRVLWIMLNPSTADAEADDPTIRKCIGFAKQWGYGSIDVVNLFAWRETNPKLLPPDHQKASGDQNRKHWDAARADCELVVAGWGTPKRWVPDDLAKEVFEAIDCLKVNKDGSPMHPLYIGYDTPLIRWHRAPLQSDGEGGG